MLKDHRPGHFDFRNLTEQVRQFFKCLTFQCHISSRFFVTLRVVKKRSALTAYAYLLAHHKSLGGQKCLSILDYFEVLSISFVAPV